MLHSHFTNRETEIQQNLSKFPTVTQWRSDRTQAPEPSDPKLELSREASTFQAIQSVITCQLILSQANTTRIIKNSDDTSCLRWPKKFSAKSKTTLWPTFAFLNMLRFCSCKTSFPTFLVSPCALEELVITLGNLAGWDSLPSPGKVSLPPSQLHSVGRLHLWGSPWRCGHYLVTIGPKVHGSNSMTQTGNSVGNFNKCAMLGFDFQLLH